MFCPLAEPKYPSFRLQLMNYIKKFWGRNFSQFTKFKLFLENKLSLVTTFWDIENKNEENDLCKREKTPWLLFCFPLFAIYSFQ